MVTNRTIFNDILNKRIEDRITVLRDQIQAGYDVDTVNDSGGTLLQSAVVMDDLEVIAELIDLGCDVNLQTTKTSPITGKKYESGFSALMRVRSLKATKLLIESGANPNLKDKFGNTALDHARLLNPEDPEKGIGYEFEIEDMVIYLESQSL